MARLALVIRARRAVVAQVVGVEVEARLDRMIGTLRTAEVAQTR